MARPFLLAVVALLAAGCPARHRHPALLEPAVESPPVLVFRDVRVFTGTSAEALEHQDVVVRDGRISDVRPTGGAVDERAVVVDGKGRTLLPGFVDFHVHLVGGPSPPWHLTLPDPDHNGRALLHAGITAAVDMGGDLDELRELSERARNGQWLGPRFWYAGPLITAEGGYPASMLRGLLPWPISWLAARAFAREIAAGGAAEAVDVHHRNGASHIKVAVAQVPLGTPTLTEEQLRAVVAAADARGLPVMAHVDTAERALLAARAGVDVLVHGIHLGELTEAQARELASLKVAVAPTLTVWNRIVQLARATYEPSPMEREVFAEDFLRQLSPEVVRRQDIPPDFRFWVEQLSASSEQRKVAVKRLYEAGVPLLVGSDASGSVACIPGAAFHDEMRLMVEAGVPPAEVLRAATSRAAQWMDARADFGTVEPTRRADLVLVDGNPLEDITATARIVWVLRDGVPLRREKAVGANQGSR